jgi:hypothetical protein
MALASWQPFTDYVQTGMVDGRYHHAAHTILLAGPPRLSSLGGAISVAGILSAPTGGSSPGGTKRIAYPMGLVQDIALSMNQGVQDFFEIGSHRRYMMTTRSQPSLQLSRPMYHGASLLRLLYAHYRDALPPTIIPPMYNSPSQLINPHDVRIPPGYENIYLNLASDLFRQPIGLMLVMRDTNNNTLAANYAESALVPSYSLSVNAAGSILQESAQLTFERLVPLAVASVGLIS